VNRWQTPYGNATAGRRTRVVRLLIFLFSLLIVGLATANPVEPGKAPSRRILVLQSTQPGLPVTDAEQGALLKWLEEHGIRDDDIYLEHLDLNRFNSQEHRNNLLALLRHKFSNIAPDLIVTLSRGAYEFLSHEGRDFFPQVPVVANVGGGPNLATTDRPGVLIQEKLKVQKTIDTVMRLFPNTTRIVFVVGTNDNVSHTVQEMKSELGSMPPSPILEFTNDLSYEDMLARVATLPANTVVVYVVFWRDGTGRTFTPIEVANRVRKAANVPVFGLWDLHIKSGLLGGHAIDTAGTSRLVGKLATDHLEGRLDLFADKQIVTAVTGDIFNWEQMQSWGIKEKDLPSSATILNRPSAVWEKHQKETTAWALLVLFLTVALTSLLLERRGHRQTTRKLVQTTEALEREIRERNEKLQDVNRLLADQSFIDGLTTLANQRRLEETLTRECQRANRSGHALSLIMIDIDHFKSFNGTYGHVVGDQCLQSIGHLLADIAHRPADLVGRFGGDKFLLILPETSHRGAIAIAEAIHAALTNRGIAHRVSRTASHVTCSCGVLTTSAPPSRNRQELLALVDGQLCRAKKEGRNRFHASDLTNPAADDATDERMPVDERDFEECSLSTSDEPETAAPSEIPPAEEKKWRRQNSLAWLTPRRRNQRIA